MLNIKNYTSMADDGKIHYSDLIQPDDSIDKLISKLGDIDKYLAKVSTGLKDYAVKLASSLKSASAATSQGREGILSEANAVEMLSQTMEQLVFASSSAGKLQAFLKQQISATNKSTLEQIKAADLMIGSYDKLKYDLSQSISLYKSLSAAERESTFGEQLLGDIKVLNSELTTLDSKLKHALSKSSDVSIQPSSYEALKRELAIIIEQYKNLSSADRESQLGQTLLEHIKLVSAEIKEVDFQLKSAFSGEEIAQPAVDSINALREKLELLKNEYANLDAATRQSTKGSDTLNEIASIKAELSGLTRTEKEAIKVAELEERIRTSQRGSYNELAAQYELNKIKLNQMSDAERENEAVGGALEEQTFQLYQQMKRLQLATGNARLNVGNYTQAWDGLSYSVAQVVREIPSAAISMNTFFLAISNNIPMVIDEIKKLKAANEAAIRSGGQATNIMGTIVKSLISWQTALVLVLAAFSKYGDKILEFFNILLHGGHVLEDTTDRLKKLHEELKEQNKDTAKNIATINALAKEWKSLKTEMEKIDFIKNRKSEFDSLDMSIRNVADAENALSENTAIIIEAFRLRAKAAAAFNLAIAQYEEQLSAEQKQEKLNIETQESDSRIKARSELMPQSIGPASTSTSATGLTLKDYKVGFTALWRTLFPYNVEEYKKNAEEYLDIYDKYMAEADTKLKEAGIKKKTTDTKDKKFNLDDYINNTQLKLKKISDDLAEAAIQDDLVKKQAKITNDYEETQKTLLNVLDKNTRLLKERANSMTKAQRDSLIQMNKDISDIMSQNKKTFDESNRRLADEKLIAELSQRDKEKAALIEALRDDTEEEFATRKSQLKIQMEKEIAVNNSLVERERIDEKLIREKYDRQLEKLELEHQNKILDIRKKANDLLIETTMPTDARNIESQLDNISIEYTKEINANRLLAPGQQVNEQAITQKYLRKAYDLYANFYDNKLKLAQAADLAEFNEIKRSEFQIRMFELQQEKARWQQKLDLSSNGLKMLTDEEIREAKSNIIRINRELGESVANVFSDGIESGILQLMGLDSNSISALDTAKQQIIGSLNEILQAEIEIAEREIELQQKRVDKAEDVYRAEITARANGYANNVAYAKRELQLQKSTLAKKQAEAEKYQRAQRMLDSLTQASSLVTATANLWATLSEIPIAGPILAAIATAGMFTAFIAAKIKASQVTATYGKGGLEFLDGGSHASGNDIDLHTKNSKGRNMRAEGGEALAVINKSNTRKYKKLLPSIVGSLNAGTFEDKFMQPIFAIEKANEKIVLNNKSSNSYDLSKIESGINKLIALNDMSVTYLSDRIIVKSGNTTKVIKK